MPASSELSAVTAAAREYGCAYRGGFAVAAGDAVPRLAGGRAAATLLLFGQVGASVWPAFCASSEYQDGEPDPMNRWSLRVGNELAARFDARALFPFIAPSEKFARDKKYLPFLRWAQKAEGLRASRLGMLIHPTYGLWHAYRFALAFASPVVGVSRAKLQPDICAACESQPCLSACPVDAFDGEHYARDACCNHLNKSDVDCHARGCLARAACPEGRDDVYPPAQVRFHLAAFVKTQCA